MAAASPLPPEQLEISGHCLLRLTTALALEAAGINHNHPSATDELNGRTGRQLSPTQWLAVLEPAYLRTFAPGESEARLA